MSERKSLKDADEDVIVNVGVQGGGVGVLGFVDTVEHHSVHIGNHDALLALDLELLALGAKVGAVSGQGQDDQDQAQHKSLHAAEGCVGRRR